VRRVSGAQIIAALCEAKGVPAAPAWNRMKKAELAALAAREGQGTRLAAGRAACAVSDLENAT